MAVTIETFEPDEITINSALSGGEITGASSGFLPLVDLLMINKFQVLNKSRQKISSTIHDARILKPFQMFSDGKQSDKPFLLTSFRMLLTEDEYDIDLEEYNNSDVINLT